MTIFQSASVSLHDHNMVQSAVLAHLNFAKYAKMKKDMLHNVQISLIGDCNTAAVRGVCPGGEIVHPKQWAPVGGRSNNAHLRWDHD